MGINQSWDVKQEESEGLIRHLLRVLQLHLPPGPHGPMRDWPTSCPGSTRPSLYLSYTCAGLLQPRVSGSSCYFHIQMKHTLHGVGSDISRASKMARWWNPVVQEILCGENFDQWETDSGKEPGRQSPLFLLTMESPRHGYSKHML